MRAALLALSFAVLALALWTDRSTASSRPERPRAVRVDPGCPEPARTWAVAAVGALAACEPGAWALAAEGGADVTVRCRELDPFERGPLGSLGAAASDRTGEGVVALDPTRLHGPGEAQRVLWDELAHQRRYAAVRATPARTHLWRPATARRRAAARCARPSAP